MKKRYVGSILFFLLLLLIPNTKLIPEDFQFHNVKLYNLSSSVCPTEYNYSYVRGYWKLNESSGNNAFDSSIFENNGTLINMEDSDWVAGKLNNALQFDGINEYVNISNNVGNFGTFDSFSFECWLNVSSGMPQYAGVLTKYDGVKGWMGFIYYGYIWFGLFSAGKFRVAYAQLNPFVVGLWYHLVCTYDGNWDINIYINGIDVNPFQTGLGTPSNIENNAPLRIGLGIAYYKGLIDNVVLYNQELQQNHINCRYNNGFGTEAFPDLIIPTWDSLTEISSPFELGNSANISLEVCDNTELTVYILFNGANYTMINIGNDIYSYNWTPTSTGIKTYTIYMIDSCGNTITVSRSITVMSTPIIVLSSIILISLGILMLIVYMKLRVFLIALTVFSFSIVFGIVSMTIVNFPFTPFLQIFFILFQGLIFFMITIEVKRL